MRAVVPVHGIRQNRKEARAWTRALCARLSGPGVVAEPYLHGWISAAEIWLPFLRTWTRGYYARGLQRFCRDLMDRTGAVELDLITHSHGSVVAWGATEKGGLVVRRLALMAPILEADTPLRELKKHAGRTLCLFSREDEVVKFSTIGLSGWEGFKFADGKAVVNLDMTPYDHHTYTVPIVAGSVDGAWDRVAAFLNG